MKAILSRVPGGPESLELVDIDPPGEPGPGKLLLRTAVVSLNFPDVLVIEDKYQFRPPRPFAPGCELAGTVEAVGEGVHGFSAGDRVIGAVSHGALAEQVIVDASSAFVMPEHMPFDIGASLLATYGTSLHALVDRGRLMHDQTLLVLGASGGVGVAAVQIGKALGARVVAATSTQEKAQAALAAGADHAIVYPAPPTDREGSRALAQLFKEAVGPAGADVIYDPVGGAYAEPALRAIAWNGRYLVIGFTAGIPSIPLNLPLLKECEITGVFYGEFTQRNRPRHRAQVERIFELWREGKLHPVVSARYPMQQAREALGLLRERRAIGKVVVEVG